VASSLESSGYSAFSSANPISTKMFPSSLEKKVDCLSGEVRELVHVLKEAVAPKENHSVPLKDERYIS